MSQPKASNLTFHIGELSREARTRAHGHRGVTLWLTGLSGSGKSTLSHRVERRLRGPVVLLDARARRDGGHLVACVGRRPGCIAVRNRRCRCRCRCRER